MSPGETTSPGETDAPHRTLMAREIDEIPEAAGRLSGKDAQEALAGAARRCRQKDPPVVLTVARGSSDHAATYLAYAVEWLIGLPVASAHPSIASVYGRGLRARGTVTFSISQSGRSEDIVGMSRSLRAGGSLVVSLTNVVDCPLAHASDVRIASLAGPELAVTATKSFTNSVIAGLWLIGHWAGDAVLFDALERLPGLWYPGSEPMVETLCTALRDADRAIFLSRGPGLGVARESALKFQEAAGIFASAYSAAEVLHGPIAALGKGVPVIALGDSGDRGMVQALDALKAIGADVIATSPRSPAVHPLVDPLLGIMPIYRAAEALARVRGLNPDAPPSLSKETVTR